VNVPVYLSSTFELTGIGTDRGWDYSRAGNPTRDRLERRWRRLKAGQRARVCQRHGGDLCAGGHAARGDHVICSHNVYAGTVRLFDQIVSGYGIEIEYVDTSNLEAVEAAIKAHDQADSH
jgi:cystathionine beta-lyase/cystathionine gamma-synthase